jgi:hypothetical protein
LHIILLFLLFVNPFLKNNLDNFSIVFIDLDFLLCYNNYYQILPDDVFPYCKKAFAPARHSIGAKKEGHTDEFQAQQGNRSVVRGY